MKQEPADLDSLPNLNRDGQLDEVVSGIDDLVSIRVRMALARERGEAENRGRDLLEVEGARSRIMLALDALLGTSS